MVHERQDFVVQVGVDKYFHEFHFETFLEVFHHRGQCALVLAQWMASEARPQGDLEVGRRAEAVPDSV